MTRTCCDRAFTPGRGRSGLICITAFAVAALTAPPAAGQAISVMGDPGAEACYHAAVAGSTARADLDRCDAALEIGALRRRDRAATHLNRGIIHAARGDQDAALADYQDAREISPDLPESFVGEGNVAFVQGDFAGALAAYDAALAAGLTARHAALFNRGLTFEKMERWDDAEAAYREAAAAAPTWSLPLAHLEHLAEMRAAAEAD